MYCSPGPAAPLQGVFARDSSVRRLDSAVPTAFSGFEVLPASYATRALVCCTIHNTGSPSRISAVPSSEPLRLLR